MGAKTKGSLPRVCPMAGWILEGSTVEVFSILSCPHEQLLPQDPNNFNALRIAMQQIQPGAEIAKAFIALIARQASQPA